MTAGGVDATAIDVFAHYYSQLEAGETGIVAEATSSRWSTRRDSPT